MCAKVVAHTTMLAYGWPVHTTLPHTADATAISRRLWASQSWRVVLLRLFSLYVFCFQGSTDRGSTDVHSIAPGNRKGQGGWDTNPTVHSTE